MSAFQNASHKIHLLGKVSVDQNVIAQLPSKPLEKWTFARTSFVIPSKCPGYCGANSPGDSWCARRVSSPYTKANPQEEGLGLL